MSNFSENDNFVSNIYILDTFDPALGGGANTKANMQARDLTDRTRWLYNRVNKIFFSYLTPGPVTLATNTVANVNGVSYTPTTFPLPSPDYTTPNDGVTRTYEISISGIWTFTETAGQAVSIFLYTTIVTPAFSEIMRNQTRQSASSNTYKKIVTLPPNTRMSLGIANGATGAIATFTDIQLVIKQL